MALQFHDTMRLDWLDRFEALVGTSPIMQIRTGSQPENAAAVSTGTLLCTIQLPVDWMAAAASGSKAKLGVWSATTSVTGTPGHFRLFETTGTTCWLQGSASELDLGGDLEIDVVPIVTGRSFIVATFTLTAPGA